MKKVFDNSMVAHVWAQQNQNEGRSNNGQFYFRGKTIYSYRDNWPLAHILDNGKILLNKEYISPTTARHLSYVRRAINESRHNIISIDSRAIMQHAIRNNPKLDGIDDTVKLYLERIVLAKMNDAAKRRMARKRAEDIGEILSECDNLSALYDALELQPPSFIVETRNKYAGDNSELLATHKAELVRIATEEKEKREKYEARQKTIALFALDAWRNGIDNVQLPEDGIINARIAMYKLDFIAMRIKGDKIETTQGAEFPIEHAIKAFQFIKRCKEQELEWHTNGHKIPLGHFKIDSIDKAGNVQAGCHKVLWPEIERIASDLGL